MEGFVHFVQGLSQKVFLIHQQRLEHKQQPAGTLEFEPPPQQRSNGLLPNELRSSSTLTKVRNKLNLAKKILSLDFCNIIDSGE